MFDMPQHNPWLQPLMTGAELATIMRYAGVTSAFRASLKNLGIRPVPGRNDIYDPQHVRHRLNVSQGMHTSATEVISTSGALQNKLTKTEERRIRRGQT
ncbi:hypothetical protein [Roseivivax sp. CAU 1753]|tara:strand:+ start:1400 stop:1696 length:297 start_codon:yes stop_codon:yes gene_type:complete